MFSEKYIEQQYVIIIAYNINLCVKLKMYKTATSKLLKHSKFINKVRYTDNVKPYDFKM